MGQTATPFPPLRNYLLHLLLSKTSLFLGFLPRFSYPVPSPHPSLILHPGDIQSTQNTSVSSKWQQVWPSPTAHLFQANMPPMVEAKMMARIIQQIMIMIFFCSPQGERNTWEMASLCGTHFDKKKVDGAGHGRGTEEKGLQKENDGSGLCREWIQVRDLESDPRGCMCVVFSVFWIAFQQTYFLLEQVAIVSGATKITTWWHQITKTFCRDGPQSCFAINIKSFIFKLAIK